MTSNGIAIATTIILLFPLGFFLMSASAFLLVKLDIPEVTQLLRGLFNAQFVMVSIIGLTGTLAYAAAGRVVFALVVGLITAFAFRGRRWFLERMDQDVAARDAGDTEAVRRLRRLHWEAMVSNAILLAGVLGSIPLMST